MMTDYMLKEYEQGAALRQISKSGEYQAATPGTSVVNWTLEPHDKEMGGLTQNVEIYLQFNSGAEVLYQTVNRSEMYDGPVGLPRFDFSLSLTQALGALGVTFVYAILRFANFAHGEIMSFGAMITILFTWFFQSQNINLGIFPTALLALPIGILATIILCIISDKFVFQYYRYQKSVPVVLAMVSIGVMFVINAIIRIIIGTETIKFSDGQKFIMKAKQFKVMTGLNEGLALKSSQVITILITIALLTFTFWFLQKTKTGKSMRAFSDNEDLALLSGINPDRVVFITWVIVGVLACVAGTLYGLDKSYKPIIYLNLVLPIFASAIVGGIGSPFGAVVGGYVIAFSEIMVTYAYKKFFVYILPSSLEPSGLVQLLSTDYKFAVSFSILVIVLLIRPSGIFKGRVL